MAEIVFWQRIISPHMACLARELARNGHKVHYVVERPMSADRQKQGWVAPDTTGIVLHILDAQADWLKLGEAFAYDTIHLVQGLRGNGYVGQILPVLRKKRARWGVIMETVSEKHLGDRLLKRLVYGLLLKKYSPDFVLAIGQQTQNWVAARGFNERRIFSFSYFLESSGKTVHFSPVGSNQSTRVGFVGQLIQRKRVDLLLDALAGLESIELVVVGDGSLSEQLRQQAQDLGLTVTWLGPLSMARAREVISSLDCLVLPSDHDGWGAVVSEALIAGVPAICSNRCGASTVVNTSGEGGVFAAGDVLGLRMLIENCQKKPMKSEDRQKLALWARCLSAPAGAKYLDNILNHIYQNAPRPEEPWSIPFRREMSS